MKVWTFINNYDVYDLLVKQFKLMYQTTTLKSEILKKHNNNTFTLYVQFVHHNFVNPKPIKTLPGHKQNNKNKQIYVTRFNNLKN